ncbi:MAG: carboxypeptidase regulatory-like domain-containing protein [Terriglobia bacterium]
MKQEASRFRLLRMNAGKFLLLLPALFLVVGCLGLQAQDLGSIAGTVTDPSGAAMPGVTITVTNQLRGNVVRTLTTNSAGSYAVPDLPASTYSLRAEKTGFTAALHSDLVLNVRSQVRVDFQLTVGAVTQQVTVTAPSVHLQTENGAESQEITGKHVAEIDTDGRNFIQLATLVPGASGQSLVGSLNVPVGVTANAGINFNGERQAHNVFSVDGQENYDRGCGGCIEIVPDQDAIAQFNVLTSSASSDVGAGSGGNVQLILKSGTSQYHGEVFEFNRNTSFDAGNFFTNSANKPKPKLDINNFGFNIGGPIALPGHAKKTFFFAELDWRKWIQGNTYTPNAPLAAWTTGDFSKSSPVILDKTKPVACPGGGTCYQPFLGNVIPGGTGGMLNANALLLAQPNFIFNSANNPNGSAQFIGSASAPINVNEQIVRIDHQFSDKTSLMAHYVRDGIDQNFPTSLWSSDSYPTVGTDFLNEPQSILLKLTRSVSPTLLNEFMIGFNRQPLTLLPIGNFKQPSGLSITRLFPNTPNADNRIPTISFAGPLNTAYDIASWPWTNVLNTWTVRDSATKVSGNHAFNFGVYYLHYLKEQQLFGNTNGNFNFNSQNATLGTAGNYINPATGAVTSTNGNSFADFMLGNAYSYTQLQVQTLPSAINTFFQPWFGDTWKAKSNLTLNYGLRWDYMPHAHERHNQVAVFRESLFNFSDAPQIDSSGHFKAGTGVLTNGAYLNGMGIAGQNGIPTILVDNHWTNFEPRFGFAWQPRPNSKTVVRGGFGLFFENIQGNDIYNVQPNPPFSNSPQLLNTSLDNPGGGTAVLTPSGLTSYDPSYLQPYSEQWNLGVQEQINTKTVASIAYVGSKSTHQQITRNINQPTAPVPTGENLNQARPYLGWGSINWYENSTNANYNSLQASLRFSAWHGLTSGASYTYSHCLDYSDNDNGGAINDAYSLAAEYGTCGYDVRHMLVVNYVYDLPVFNTATGAKRAFLGGWELSGITTIYSGGPLTIGSNADTAHCGCGGYRADLVGNANNGPRTQAEWFNIAAFAAPANNTFGNAARNIVDGAGIDNFDVSLFKNFAGIPFPGNKEGATMQLRFEFYNFFNTTQFNGFSTTFQSGNFGQATSTRLPRELQIGAQFIF